MKTPGSENDIKNSGHHGALAGEAQITGTSPDQLTSKDQTGISGTTSIGFGEKVDTTGKTSS